MNEPLDDSRELDRQCTLAMGYTEVQIAPASWRHAGELVYEVGRGHLAWDAEEWRIVPRYSSDHAAARMLEDEIEQRGRWAAYLAELMVQVIPIKERFTGSVEPLTIHSRNVWNLIRATPEQKARAFLSTISPRS